MRKPNVPTMILVFALVAIGVVSGLAIATGFGAPGMPVVAFTPLPTTATPAAPATAVAAATTGSTAAAEASPTAGAAATTATSRPSATSGATATAEASATARASATSGASATARATATAQASATAVASEEFIEYTVQRGDTLNVIARRYGVTAEEIQALNNITDPRSLIVGTVLRIPRP